MNKVWIIIKREYLERVRKRSFILATLLTPLAFAAFIAFEIWIVSYDAGNEKPVLISDTGNIMNGVLPKSDALTFELSKDELAVLKKNFDAEKYSGILEINPMPNISQTKDTVRFYTDDKLGIANSLSIQNAVSEAIREYKIGVLKLDKAQLDVLDTDITVDPEPLKKGGKDESADRTNVAAAIGSVMGLIMYITVFLYGMMVMRSVMEEKTNRIVEVVISAVKPFELMLGKIIGVGAVGLTQLSIWLILGFAFSSVIPMLMSPDPAQLQQMNDLAKQAGENPMMQSEAQNLMKELSSINWWMIVPLFVFYFLAGYLLYASLFAAVGSAIGDDIGESQTLTVPITIPVALALIIMMNVIKDPNSNLAIWSSMFPLFSPIIMPARLAFEPPLWQIALSVLLLIAGCWFFVWLAGRIYRVGILMYGKKVTFKELAKWIFYKD